MLTRFATLSFVTLLALPALAQASPVDVIKSAEAELQEQLDGRKDEFAQDKDALYAMIDEILLPRFDRHYAARLVLGRHWRAANDAQRERFIQAFYRSLLRRYADGVLEYDQDKVEILPWRGAEGDERTMVRTNVTLDDGTEVPVHYALVRRDDGWKIFDVNIEGISYVRNFRAELNTEIQQKGLEAVIERLESEADGDGDSSDT